MRFTAPFLLLLAANAMNYAMVDAAGATAAVDGAKATAAPVDGAIGDVLATWISRHEGCRSAQEANTTIAALAAKGINRIYVDVWANGAVYFNSPTAAAAGATQGGDQLGFCLDAARAQTGGAMQVWAWFEYGLMAAYGAPTSNAFARTAQGAGWVLGQSGGFTWLDPQNAAVGAFLSGLLNDAAAPGAYPGLAGVQLDDHFATPSSLGRRGAALDALAARVTGASKLPVSLAPAVPSFSKASLQADWLKWANAPGMTGFAEFAPQLYRTSYSSFASELGKVERGLARAPAARAALVAGLRCNGSGAPTDWNDLAQMLARSRQDGVGISVWYSVCVTATYADKDFKPQQL